MNKILLALAVIVAVLYGFWPFADKPDGGVRLTDGTQPAQITPLLDTAPEKGSALNTVDLRDHEGGEHNGHAISRHVGKSDVWLKRRLQRDEHIPAASSFASLEKANKLVNDTLAANREKLTLWLREEDKRATLDVRKRFKAPTGRGVIRGQDEAQDFYQVVVRMEKAPAAAPGSGFVIWNAYPEK